MIGFIACLACRHFPDEKLHAALDGLPELYRRPLILFHFGRLSLDGAAEALACRPAIVRARLSRGRAMLRARLGRRGIRIADAAVGAWLDDAASPAAVPPGFVDAVVEAASRWAAGGTDADVGVHPRILALAREILEGGDDEHRYVT
jgi:hypothetical protein